MKKLFSMIREFQLADWFALANAVCGTYNMGTEPDSTIGNNRGQITFSSKVSIER